MKTFLLWQGLIMDKKVYLYFYASFLNAGLQNVIPQVYFGQHYPNQEALLLSICLLAGALSSIATIWLTHTYRMDSIPIPKPFVWSQVIGIVLLTILLWYWQTAVWYIITFVLLRAIIQVLFNRVDHHYVMITVSEHMPAFARSSTIYRLLGIMIGPFYFAFIYPYNELNFMIVLLLSAVLLWTFSGMYSQTSQQQVEKDQVQEEIIVTPIYSQTRRQMSRQSLFFIIYLLTATTGVYVFSSNIVMLVRDYYGVAAAVAKSGTLLLLMNATGITMVVVWPTVSKLLQALMSRRLGISIYSGQAKYAVLFLFCVILLKWPLVLSYHFLLILSMFTGAVYGLFWMKTREFVVHQPGGVNQRWILTLYNNANNFSILLSSIILLVVASWSAQVGSSYLSWITTALLICFAMSAIYACLLDLQTKKLRKEND